MRRKVGIRGLIHFADTLSIKLDFFFFSSHGKLEIYLRSIYFFFSKGLQMIFIVISSVYPFSAKLLLFVVFCQLGMTGFVYVPRT